MNQLLAKQLPVWDIAGVPNGRVYFTYCPGRLNMPLSWLDRRLGTISDPRFSAATEKEILPHTRGEHT